MTKSIGQVPVGSEEWLARFVLRKEHIRSDGTLKPDPFIPYKRIELSVTRHLGLNEEEIRAAGQLVATQVRKNLRGRGDTQTHVFRSYRLRVEAAPIADNSNHANVVDWPPDKQAQKEIAIELVRSVRFVHNPPADL